MANHRLAYQLEEQIEATRLRDFSFDGLARIALYHRSTLAHLTIFLEEVLSNHPKTEILVATWMRIEHIRADYDYWDKLAGEYRLQLLGAPGFKLPAGDVSAAIMLYSPAVSPPDEMTRALKRSFLRVNAPRKAIIDGGGTVWDGRWQARLKRRFWHMRLARIAPARDVEEGEILEKAIPPDPGYDAWNPPILREPDEHGRTLVLEYPVRLEREPETGNIVRPELIATPVSSELYEGEYHAGRFPDHYEDQTTLLRTYQQRRLRNMQKVGLRLEGRRDAGVALDYGCGTGGLAALLHDKGYRTIAVDMSKTCIERARTAIKGPVFDRADTEELRKRGLRFDLITLCHVLDHIPRDIELLRSLRVLLNPGGRLYVEVPWLDREAVRRRRFWYRQRDHVREYTKIGLYHSVASAGFRILKHEDSLEDEGSEPHQFLLAEPPASPTPIV